MDALQRPCVPVSVQLTRTGRRCPRPSSTIGADVWRAKRTGKKPPEKLLLLVGTATGQTGHRDRSVRGKKGVALHFTCPAFSFPTPGGRARPGSSSTTEMEPRPVVRSTCMGLADQAQQLALPCRPEWTDLWMRCRWLSWGGCCCRRRRRPDSASQQPAGRSGLLIGSDLSAQSFQLLASCISSYGRE